MIIKCKECDFRFVSRKDQMDELVTEKAEHEFVTHHKTVFLLTLGAKVIEKENPEFIHTGFCNTCWENDVREVYSTISKLDLKRHIEVHNSLKSEKEKKFFIEHVYNITTGDYNEYESDLIKRSNVIQKMIQDGISASEVNLKEKSMVTGDEELAFYLQSDGARDVETVIAYRIYKLACPLCDMPMISEEDIKNDFRILDKRFDIIYSHVKNLHDRTKYTSVVINILQMCILYQRNIVHAKRIGLFEMGKKGLSHNDMTRKRDKRSQAMRTLNKTGIPMTLLEKVFELGTSNLGKMTYRGMEILGKPEWVQKVENQR